MAWTNSRALSGGARALVPHFLDVAQGVTEPGEPGVRVLSGEPHAPGQRVAATAGHARLDQRVQHPALGLAQPRHHRDRQCGEHLTHVGTGDTPGHLAAELVLGLPRDLDAATPGLLAEPADPALGGRGPLGVRGPGRLRGGQHADDRDLLAVRLDVRGGGEPVTGEPAGEPAAHFFGSVRLARALTAGARVVIRAGRVVCGTRVWLRCIHVIMITGTLGLVKHYRRKVVRRRLNADRPGGGPASERRPGGAGGRLPRKSRVAMGLPWAHHEIALLDG